MITVLLHFSIYIKYKTVKQLTKWKRDKVRFYLIFILRKFCHFPTTNQKRDKCYKLKIIFFQFKQSSIFYSTKAFSIARGFGLDSRECDYELK